MYQMKNITSDLFRKNCLTQLNLDDFIVNFAQPLVYIALYYDVHIPIGLVKNTSEKYSETSLKYLFE